jgi:hypothetical protein
MTLYDNFSRGTLVFHAASIASPIFYQKSDAFCQICRGTSSPEATW